MLASVLFMGGVVFLSRAPMPAVPIVAAQEPGNKKAAPSTRAVDAANK